MISFRIKDFHQRTFKVNVMTFPGGEVQIKVPYTTYVSYEPTDITITAELRNSDDIMALLNTNNFLRSRFPGVALSLELGYVPYARQDRACAFGESHSLQVMAGLINSMELKQVLIADPHSDVTPALINNCKVVTMADLLLNSLHIDLYAHKEVTLVAPDAGATKKVQEVMNRHEGGFNFVQGVKVRDTTTGGLTGFDAYGDVFGEHCLILDDICDGGGTFAGLAKVLKDKGASRVDLYVTHGIFSKGLGVLLDTHIDSLFTTNTLTQTHDHPRFHVSDWL